VEFAALFERHQVATFLRINKHHAIANLERMRHHAAFTTNDDRESSWFHPNGV
jgi:hypothetical protein